MNKIEELKNKFPNINAIELEQLVSETAKSCMDMIVQNADFNGRGENGWWTIHKTYNIQVDNESDCLPENRTEPNEMSLKFPEVCEDENLEKMKECLKNGAKIIRTNRFGHIMYDAVACAAKNGKLKTLDFLLRDPFIKNNPLFNRQVDISYDQDYLFKELFNEKQLISIEYLIVHHNIETSKEVQKFLKESDDPSMKSAVLRIIENKYLNIALEISLDDSKESNVKKPKI